MTESTQNKRPLWLKFLNGINIIRLLIVNFVFFGLIGIAAIVILIVILAGREPQLIGNRILWLAPSGMIVENYSSSDFQRQLNQMMEVPEGEVLLTDILKAVDAAAEDKRIIGLYLDLSSLNGAGLSSVQEIQKSLLRFKATGKKVYAYSPTFTQVNYSLSSPADHIAMDPFGQLRFRGFSMSQAYFKKGLDKLGVRINVFRAGEYKSFVEPFIDTKMSEKVREESQRWLNQIWASYVDMVCVRDLVTKDDFNAYMNSYLDNVSAENNAPSDIALKSPFIDSIQYQENFEDFIEQELSDSHSAFDEIFIYYEDYLLHIPKKKSLVNNSSIAVIVADGDIVFGEGFYGSIGSAAFTKLINRVKEGSYDALVLRINSGGGSAHASELIRRSLAELRESGIPVVVSMGEAAASGGYWIANESDYILAYPTTITGSIGVFTIIPTFQEALDKWGGITFDSVKSEGGVTRMQLGQNLSDEEKILLQSDVDWLYGEFLSLISRNRSLEKDDIIPLAGGRIWTGKEAVENGLVDALGGWDESLDKAAELGGLGNSYSVDFILPEESFRNQLADNRFLKILLKQDSSMNLLNLIVGNSSVDKIKKLNDPNGIYAYVNIRYLRD